MTTHFIYSHREVIRVILTQSVPTLFADKEPSGDSSEFSRRALSVWAEIDRHKSNRTENMQNYRKTLLNLFDVTRGIGDRVWRDIGCCQLDL